jgi:hypothetical protein
MFLVIARTDTIEPRWQAGRYGVQLLGVDFSQLKPGNSVAIDGETLGYPIERLADLPPGDYFIQAVLSKYTQFKRSDGKTIWMRNDQWEGQNWRSSPGNIASEVKKLTVRAGQRQTVKIEVTSQQRNLMELVNGTNGRSGEQLHIWSAVFGPIGNDGYFKPLFDKRTREIDSTVAQYWKEQFDLRNYLQTHWKEVGPKLAGKLHVTCGRKDDFAVNVGVYYTEEFLESTRDPYYAGSFDYGERGGHGWSPYSGSQLLRIMSEHITQHAPAGSDVKSWKY